MISKVYEEHHGGSLAPVGNDLLGLCPFHDDSSPSFSLNDDKEVYNCFACGAKGNLISFAANLKGLSDGDAVKWLHSKYRIDFTHDIRYLLASLPKKVPLKYRKMEQAKWMDSRYCVGNARFASRKMLEAIDHKYATLLLKKIDAHPELFEGLFVLYFGINGSDLNVVYARLFDKPIKYYQLLHRSGTYGNIGSSCYLVEGFSDCDALTFNGRNAVSMNGLKLDTVNHNLIKRAIVWVDGDDAGRNFLLKLKDADLKFIVDVVWTEGYDPNDYMKKHGDIPKEVSYMEWWAEHGIVTDYAIADMILNKPNLCDLSKIDEAFCRRHGLNENVLSFHVDTGKLRNRGLALQVMNSAYSRDLPEDFFGYGDIDECYAMRRSGKADAMQKYSHLLTAQSVPPADAMAVLRRLYQARVLRKNIPNIASGRVDAGALIVKEDIEKKTTLLEAYRENLNRDDMIIPYPMPTLKKRYGGLYKATLAMVGGITGSSKTTFCVNLMHQLCEAGKNCIYFNKDMREYELVNRLLALKSKKELSKMKRSDLDFANSYSDYLSHVCIDSDMSFSNIRSNVAGYDVVFIDYIQGIKNKNDKQEKYQFLLDATGELKQLAVKHSLCVVVVSQYNSGKEYEANNYDKVAGSKGMMNDMDISLLIKRRDDGSARTVHVNKCRYAEDGAEIKMRVTGTNLEFVEVGG